MTNPVTNNSNHIHSLKLIGFEELIFNVMAVARAKYRFFMRYIIYMFVILMEVKSRLSSGSEDRV